MIAIVIIASGYSRRMGRSKLALELGGRTFLGRVVGAALEAKGVGRRLVVVRPEDTRLVDDAVAQNPEGVDRVETLENSNAASGQSASIVLATATLEADPDCEAVVFAVVDQPFMDARIFDTLLDAWRARKGEILISTYAGERGNPVLFARRFFGELTQLAGDVGGRAVIGRHTDVVAEVPMPDPSAGRDVDTWEEYLALRQGPPSPAAGGSG